ncbi:hypothetical protein NN561_018808 [Cricetulus griseus]
MPRSFLVKKIKADGFQCSGVPAPTYHPLETAYVLPGARGPPGDNGEWALGEGSGGSPTWAVEGNPREDVPGRVRPRDFLRACRAGLGLGRTKESGRVGSSRSHAPAGTLKVVALEYGWSEGLTERGCP